MSDETTVDASELEETGQSSDEASQEEPQAEQQTQAIASPAFDMDEIRAAVRDEVSRTMQSFTDRQEDQIAKRVDAIYGERLKAYKAAGVELSPQEEAMERKEIAREVVRDPNRGGEARTPSDSATSLADQHAKDLTAAQEAIRAAGLTGHPYAFADPHAVDPDLKNPSAWKTAFEKALKERTSQASTQEETPGSPSARLGSVGQTGGNQLEQLNKELADAIAKHDINRQKELRAEILNLMK
jgi:hypothetical protein